MRWNIDPVLFKFGFLQVRWYGLFFATGILLGARAITRVFEDRHLKKEDAERLTIWLVIGMILGAHFIHLAFYEPESFVDNPRRIIEIGVGLASHGGALGAILALFLFCRRYRLDFFRHADASIVAALWVAPWVRIGNFFNSEIVGRPTDVPWGIIFERRGFTTPRHPSQLYEALAGFALLAFAVWLNAKYRDRLRAGATLFLLLLVYFIIRFSLEFFKAYEAIDPSSPLTMGQYLSLPFLLLCVTALFISKRFRLWPLLDAPP
jgi:phosphatidylglycerol---prolipoprotein diacylglyceryl transferase